MLGYLHALGAVLWYDLPKLRELVIIDPQARTREGSVMAPGSVGVL